MWSEPLGVRARALWEELADVPVSFGPQGSVNVVVAPRSALCPAGWFGAVALGGSAIVTAPSDRAAATVRHVLDALPVEAVVDGDLVGAALPVVRTLGPAALSYASPASFRPTAAGAWPVRQLPAGHTDLRALRQVVGEADAGEAGLDEITSSAYVVREQGQVVAAAGYRTWPRRTAHVSVLTAPSARGRGLARATGSAAVAHALDAGLLPQWRARPAASRRVAAALGFEELGTQLSFELD